MSELEASSPLLDIAVTDRDAFLLILQFCAGDPQTFLRLGKTCRAFRNVFAPTTEVTWQVIAKQLRQHQVMAAAKVGKNRKRKNPDENGMDEEDYKVEFLEDPRLKTAFEKVMVGHTLAKIKETQQTCHENIFLKEYGDEFRLSYLGPMVRPFLGPLPPRWLGMVPEFSEVIMRSDFQRCFAQVLEANMVAFMQKGLAASNHRSSDNEYPVMGHSDLFCSLINDECSMDNMFGGTFNAFPRLEAFEPAIQLEPSLHQTFLVNYRIARHLAYKAGVVKMTTGTMKEIWYIAIHMSTSLLWLMALEQNKTCDLPVQGAINRFLANVGSAEVNDQRVPQAWVPLPSELETAAVKLGLHYCKVYDSGDAQADAEENFCLYWKSMTRKQREEFRNAEETDSDDSSFDRDMDLDLNNFPADFDSLSDDDDRGDISDNESMGFSFEAEDDDISMGSENGGDIESDSNDEDR